MQALLNQMAAKLSATQNEYIRKRASDLGVSLDQVVVITDLTAFPEIIPETDPVKVRVKLPRVMMRAQFEQEFGPLPFPVVIP